MPEYLPLSAAGGDAVGADLSSIIHRRLWRPAWKTVKLQVQGCTDTTQVLLLLLGLFSTHADQQQQQEEQQALSLQLVQWRLRRVLLHRRQRQQLQRKLEHRCVSYLVSGLETYQEFSNIRQHILREVARLQESCCSSCSKGGSSSSSSWCDKEKRKIIEEGVSLLHAAPIPQHHVLSWLFRYRLAAAAAPAAAAAAAARETEKETDRDSGETEPKCKADPMASGCTARDIADTPLVLVIRKKRPISTVHTPHTPNPKP